MRKTLLTLLVVLFLSGLAFADRNTATTQGYTSNALIKRGDVKIYSINYIATANGGGFSLYDAVTFPDDCDIDSVKSEGAEATALNGKYFDYSNKPLEFSTGAYLMVHNADVIVEYE